MHSAISLLQIHLLLRVYLTDPKLVESLTTIYRMPYHILVKPFPSKSPCLRLYSTCFQLTPLTGSLQPRHLQVGSFYRPPRCIWFVFIRSHHRPLAASFAQYPACTLPLIKELNICSRRRKSCFRGSDRTLNWNFVSLFRMAEGHSNNLTHTAMHQSQVLVTSTEYLPAHCSGHVWYDLDSRPFHSISPHFTNQRAVEYGVLPRK